jgi:ATP-binding cassette subfamily F protein uup
MPLLSLRDIHLAHGGPELLDGVRLQIERGERICLLGRNGAGKSTLMNVIAGELEPDDGEIVRQQGVTVAHLPQEIPADIAGTVYDVAAAGIRPHTHHDRPWEVRHQVEAVLTRLGLDPGAAFASLSGGRKRQALLARALVSRPDLLLLDEPTNHMDVDAIAWLEEYLLDEPVTLLFVTHDRAFLRRVATRIIELDRGRLVDWACDYDTFLQRKEAMLDAESKAWANFDKKLAAEEAWIRQGIQARRTRNEGRVRALEAMRRERMARRERTGTVRLASQEVTRSGRVVIEAEHLSFDYPAHPIVRDFSTTILRGDKVGVIGPNGSGKTTLLQLLLGRLEPDEGTVRLGTGVEVAWFGQLREELDGDRTVQENVAGTADHVTVNGNRRHVLSYLSDFLFPPERARTPVRVLSGGERNRLLLARLFTRSFNLLVMDEPTNDLDAETLELLEALLVEFPGTVLLVSHDREFLDEVVTSTLVLEGGGKVGEYVGGYEDWRRQTGGRVRPLAKPPRQAARTAAPARSAPAVRKLTLKERRELEQLPQRIEALEAEQAALHVSLADPALHRAGTGVVAVREKLAGVERELAEAFARWEALEALA